MLADVRHWLLCSLGNQFKKQNKQLYIMFHQNIYILIVLNAFFVLNKANCKSYLWRLIVSLKHENLQKL